MAQVKLENVGKTYQGGVEAVSHVTLTIPDGQMCVLVGPSGCGKSTLLRMIAGLETITQGEVTINNRVVNELEPSARDIAFVFQNYALYPHMSVYDNMAYGLKNLKTPKEEIKQRVEAAAKTLELEELLTRKPRQLSGGQRQRVAMGRAIVRKPQVFLFDEPLSNLDAKLRVTMRLEIKKLQRQLGVTSVYVTHDQLEAMTLADILVVMNKGKVEQIGTPLEIYEKPASLFAATFIGAPHMNLIKQGEMTLGVRPEHLLLGVSENNALNFKLTLQFNENVGAETYLYGTSETGETLTLRLAGKHSQAAGTVILCHVLPENLHAFNTQTGLRLEKLKQLEQTA
jgi:sn-glycerol 3-phosphate transport system ATP-binding protein